MGLPKRPIGLPKRPIGDITASNKKEWKTYMMKLIELRAKERGYPTNDDLIRRLALPLEIRIETLRNYLAINDEAFSTECFRLGIKLLENNEALVIQNQVTSQDVIKAIEELEKKLVKIEQERPQLAVESKD